MSKVLQRLTLRLAVDPTQGRGWSEYEGDDWVNPTFNGILTLVDDNNVRRQVIEDRNDDTIYEFGTWDTIGEIGPSWVDKRDVQDTEIATQQWFGEVLANSKEFQKKIEEMVSHLQVRPQNPYNKGDQLYDSEGYRTGQSFSLDVYAEGSLARALAQAGAIPQDGDITYSGYTIKGRRIMFVAKSTTSEFHGSEISHKMVLKPKQGTVAERTMTRDTVELALASKYYHISRDTSLLFERVSRGTIAGTATATDGPDSRTGSGFVVTAALPLTNTVFTGAYTFIVWSKALPTVTGLPVALTAYGDPEDGWQMYYAQEAANTLPALTLSAGSYFDIRISQSVLSETTIDELREDTIYNKGNGLLPVF